MSDFGKYNAQPVNETLSPRTRGDILALCDGREYHITHFAFDSGKFGEYAYFYLAEDNEHTFYGGKRVTSALRAIQADGLAGEIAEHTCKFNKCTFTATDGKVTEYADVQFNA